MKSLEELKEHAKVKMRQVCTRLFGGEVMKELPSSLRCTIRRGVFSGERFFDLNLGGKILESVAPVDSFRTVDNKRLEKTMPAKDSSIDGIVSLHLVSRNDSEVVINFPDGEYQITTAEEVEKLRA